MTKPKGYKDYVIKLAGDKEGIVIRHYASSIPELLSREEEFISDIYECQWIRKSEIASVHYDPGPYVGRFIAAHGRIHRDLTELYRWAEGEGL
jgi:hypothetical protein